jgi:hypothetical protein
MMPYYHATFRDRLPSILKHGLGWPGAEPNWPGVDRGVYLAEAPEVAVFVMFDWMMQMMDESVSPKDFIESLVVILIDDTRVRRQDLGPDPEIARRDDVWLYRGVIDVRNQPVLELDQVLPKPDKQDFDATRAWMRQVWGRSFDDRRGC